jgi:hypothetical protein
MKAAWLILATLVFSFGQTTDKKATVSTTKKTTAPCPSPDTWQKVKECTARSEAVMAAWPKLRWRAHYSPKYNRCFIQETFLDGGGVDITLSDAFEMFVPIAESSPTAKNCYLDGPEGGQQNCDKVLAFIKDHMKN